MGQVAEVWEKQHLEMLRQNCRRLGMPSGVSCAYWGPPQAFRAQRYCVCLCQNIPSGCSAENGFHVYKLSRKPSSDRKQ